MKNVLFILALLFSNLVYSQQYFSGALPTNSETYQRIGQAPLPIGSNIPNSVDLSEFMPPVGNQYPQNSCVAWAVAYASYSYVNSSTQNCEYISDNYLNNQCLFSPSYVYNQINGGQNKGTYFQDAFHVMQTQGVAPLSAMPYIPNNWWVQPDNNARQIAANYKIDSYWQLGSTGEDIFMESKAYLAKGVPVIASVKVDNYLKRQQNFPVPYVWSSWSGSIESMGHAIVIVGYDDNLQAFKFLNSYGGEWGNKGYGYISYNMYKKAINEAFIIKTRHSNSTNEKNILASESKYINVADKKAGLSFNITGVSHVLFNYIPTPQEIRASKMTFSGTVAIPAGLGSTAQVAIYFYYDVYGSKGPFVGSVNPYTRTYKGEAVTATPIANLQSNQDFQTIFYAQMSYTDLTIPQGLPYRVFTTNLIAEPVLLIDGFPVRIGEPHHFYVSF